MNHPPAVKLPPVVASLRSRSAFFTTVWLLGLLACGLSASFSARAQINVIPLPNDSYAQPQNMVWGPDNAYWFAVFAGAIGRVDTNGNLIEPFSANNPFDIIVGPDGNLWFTELGTDSTRPHQPRHQRLFYQWCCSRFPCHPGVNTNSSPSASPPARTATSGSLNSLATPSAKWEPMGKCLLNTVRRPFSPAPRFSTSSPARMAPFGLPTALTAQLAASPPMARSPNFPSPVPDLPALRHYRRSRPRILVHGV